MLKASDAVWFALPKEIAAYYTALPSELQLHAS
jgi:hypothetical protein